MRKAILCTFYVEQEIPEVNSLEEIEEAGTYAVAGYDQPVYVAPVKSYGGMEILRTCSNAFFFEGADGGTYCGKRCGEYVKEGGYR